MKMNMFYKGFLAVFLLVLVLVLSACRQEGPAERAGRNVDQAVEQTGEPVDRGMEYTGRKIAETGEAIGNRQKTGE